MNKTFKITGLFFILLSIFTLSMICVHIIPLSWIKDNIIQSAKMIEKEGMYPDLGLSVYQQLDNYTDALMLDIAASADDGHPLKAAMNNTCHYLTTLDSMAYAAEFVAKGDTDQMINNSYGRYWHGYQVILRPLLIVMPLTYIRFFHGIIFAVLLFFLCKNLYNSSKPVTLFFVISLLFVSFPVVPLSMQFSTCFFIAFAAMLALMKVPTLTTSPFNTFATFFVVGGFTSFLDLLVTPQLTLGLPLITYFLLQEREKPVIRVILFSIAWVVGYALIWMSKWLIATVLVGGDFIKSAITNMEHRANSLDDSGNSISLYRFIEPVMKHLLSFHNGILLYAGIILFILCAILYARLFKGGSVLKQNAHYLIIAAIVPVWFFFMRNHSIEHIWFTWRAWSVTLFSLLIFIYNTTDTSKKLSLCRKLPL